MEQMGEDWILGICLGKKKIKCDDIYLNIEIKGKSIKYKFE